MPADPRHHEMVQAAAAAARACQLDRKLLFDQAIDAAFALAAIEQRTVGEVLASMVACAPPSAFQLELVDALRDELGL